MSRIRNFVLALAGIFIIFLMVELAGLEEVLEVVQQVNPPIFVLAISCELVSCLFWAVRWKVLLRSFKKVNFRNTIIGIFIGVFFNNLTPMARAGGEPFRAFFMQEKEGVPVEDAFATVTVDHVLDAFPFLFIMLFALVYFLFFVQTSLQMIIIICLSFLLNLLILFLVLFFSFNVKAAKKLVFSFFRFVGFFTKTLEKHKDQAESAVERYNWAMKTLSSQRRDLAVSLGISFALWFILIVRNYLVVISLGYEVDFMVIVVVQVVGTLIGLLPLLPGGLGSVEGITIFLYLSFQFPAAVAVTASLLDRFISFWMMMMIGVLFVIAERKFLKIE